MDELSRLLSNNFTVLDLGSASSTGLAGLKPFWPSTTLVEIDAVAASATDSSQFYKRIAIRSAVGGTAGRRTFYKCKFQQSSSFLQFDDQVVKNYGLSDLLESDGSVELECENIQSILAKQGFARVDFMKTDLEGLDFEVLASAPNIVGNSLVVQSELRFQPMYLGEPNFATVSAYLNELGFELITLRPEVWKYATRNSDTMRDGRMVWADAIFFLKPNRVKELLGDGAPLGFLKQVILATALDLRNYAEYLYENVMLPLTPAADAELQRFLAPKRRLHTISAGAVNRLARIPGGNRAMLGVGHVLLSIARIMSVSKQLKHIAPPF